MTLELRTEQFPARDGTSAIPPAGTGRMPGKPGNGGAGAPGRVGAGPGRHGLLLKFALLNLIASAVFAAAVMQGWVGRIVQADHTGLSILIAGVFLSGLLICGYKVWRISNELNCVRRSDPCDASWATRYIADVAGRGAGSRSIAAASLRTKLGGWIAIVRQFANSLVILGMIGTVVGFVIALSAIDADSVSDVSQISGMVGSLLTGMSVALYTTLVGAVLSLWLTVNYNLLSAGTQFLMTALISLGEQNARS